MAYYGVGLAQGERDSHAFIARQPYNFGVG